MNRVYVLRDPDTYEVRYVGQTNQSLEARLSDHVKRCKKDRNAKAMWIKGLVERGERPIIELVIECEDDVTNDERMILDQYISMGYILLNTRAPAQPSRLCPMDYMPFLGTMSDADLGRMFGRQSTTIREQRIKRGIPPFRHSHLNAMNVNEYRHLLGKVSDSEIARRYGVSKQAVIKNRKKLGIESAVFKDWSSYYPLMGTVSDAKIARVVGLTKGAVMKKRHQLGIPSMHTNKKVAGK